MRRAAIALSGLLLGLTPSLAMAAEPKLPGLLGAGHASAPIIGPTSSVQMAVILSLLTLAPAIILSATCFARFIIVFSFLKSGLGTPGAPPNQVLVGLSLFMTMFIMAPVAKQVQDEAVSPYLAGKLDEGQAIDAATPAVRTFLLHHTRQSDLALFYEVAKGPRPHTAADVPLRIALPSFVLSELRTAFEMGLVVLLPFLVIDLFIATVLSSLGMVMVPPAVIALPIKILVFVSADGWQLVVRSLLRGFV